MLCPLPKRLFVACKDISGSDDLYLFTTLSDPILWRQVYYRAGEAGPEPIDDCNLRLVQFNNIVIITTIFASSPDYSYISFDRGSSWNTFFSPPAYVFGGSHESLIYCSSADTLYKTINKGSSWSTVCPYPLPGLGGLPLEIYSFNETIVITADSGTILRSANYGTPGSWTAIPTGLAAIIKTLRNGNTIVAFDSTGNSSKSLDHGLTWQAIVPSPNPAKTFHDADFSDNYNSHIFMTLDEQIYVSLDFCSSWRLAGSVSPGIHLDSIVQSTDYSLFSINNSGLFFKIKSYGESIDQYSFNPFAPAIRPFAVRKISAQTNIALESIITRNRLTKSPIRTHIISGSAIVSHRQWYLFTCGVSYCGCSLGEFYVTQDIKLDASIKGR